jgi:hypothetical protein
VPEESAHRNQPTTKGPIGLTGIWRGLHAKM